MKCSTWRLCVLLAMTLVGCKTLPAPVEVQIKQVPVEVTIPIDPKLTAHGKKPARPANKCQDAKGRPSICNKDLAAWLNAYDRFADDLTNKLDAILGLQPKAKP